MIPRHATIAVQSPGRATITVDGQELHGVTGIKFGANRGELATLILDMPLLTFDLDSDAVITVPEETAEALLALGWTPPAEQPYGGSGRPTAWRHSCGELNEGAEHGMCGACRFDVDSNPEDIEHRYVLVELPTIDRGDDAASR